MSVTIVVNFLVGRDGRNRTHTEGFGDLSSTTKLRPCSQQILETIRKKSIESLRTCQKNQKHI